MRPPQMTRKQNLDLSCFQFSSKSPWNHLSNSSNTQIYVFVNRWIQHLDNTGLSVGFLASLGESRSRSDQHVRGLFEHDRVTSALPRQGGFRFFMLILEVFHMYVFFFIFLVTLSCRHGKWRHSRFKQKKNMKRFDEILETNHASNFVWKLIFIETLAHCVFKNILASQEI